MIPRKVQLSEAAQAAELKEHPDLEPLEIPAAPGPRSVRDLVAQEVRRFLRDQVDDQVAEQMEDPMGDPFEGPEWDSSLDPLDGLTFSQLLEMEAEELFLAKQAALDEAALLEVAPEVEEEPSGSGGDESGAEPQAQ